MASFGRYLIYEKRPLRVLHLPINTCRIPENIIAAQKDIGIETRTFFTVDHLLDRRKETIQWIPWRNERGFLKGYPRHAMATARYLFSFLRSVWWADIVHWQYSNRCWRTQGKLRGIDFLILRLLRKPRLVQFHGSEIRDNNLCIEENPWFAEAFSREQFAELSKLANETQKAFGSADFFFALGYGLVQYVWPEHIEKTFILERAVDTESFIGESSRKNDGRIVIAHGPSEPQRKGSHYIAQAVDEISKKRDIEYVFLTNMDHDEVINAMHSADIEVDQLLCGDFGVAAIEAMACGCVAVANVSDSLQEAYPDDLPIVFATPETIQTILLELIDDPQKRERLSLEGQAYAKKHHSIQAICADTLDVYYRIAKKKKRKKLTHRIKSHIDMCAAKKDGVE